MTRGTQVGDLPVGGGAPAPPAPRARRWLARLALLLAAAAIGVLFGGALSRPWLIAVNLGGVGLVLAALWWVLSRRGARRLLAAALAVAVLAALIALFVVEHRAWEVAASVLLTGGAVVAGRGALVRVGPEGMPEQEAAPVTRPFLVMNPRSGGGKVGRFGLVEQAEHRGARVVLLDGPGPVDVAGLARRAVEDGADLLGVAGGDGTQALVAAVAAEHRLPFLVLAAGTRNHFAMDLGLDRQRPDRGLDALTDGVEVRLDLGRIDGRVFVNNASFGAYASVVQSPAYRDDKVGTTLELLPDLLAGHRGPRLRVRVDGGPPIEGPAAVLVSNNPYGTGDVAGLDRRPRLDTGRLGVVAVTVTGAGQAAGLLAGRHGPGLRVTSAHEVVVEADTPEIAVGVDGEALLLPTPVRCTIEPGALRVRLPRSRPGVPEQRPTLDWRRLWHEAVGRSPDPDADARPGSPAGGIARAG